MNETILDFLDFGFDLLCAAAGLFCLLRCTGMMDAWMDVFQRVCGG